MTVREIEKKLSSFGVESPRDEAILIIDRLFGVSRASILAEPSRDYCSGELDALLEKRRGRVPLQYIFGEWEFMGKEFYVSPDCLIPQPDTEILTEKALEIMENSTVNAKCKMQISDTPRTRADRRCAIGEVELMQGSEASRNAKLRDGDRGPQPEERGMGFTSGRRPYKVGECGVRNAELGVTMLSSSTKQAWSPFPAGEGEESKMQNAKLQDGENGFDVADLCTGSGCIGLSLLMYGDVGSMVLMDISEGALDMARKNAHRHGLEDRCEFILGDIRYDMPRKKFDLIVSNPPYIPTKDIEGLPDEVKKEPRLALDGGTDGLDIIRFLLGEGLSYLKDGGHMLIEFGYDQGEIMDALLREKRDTGSIKSYEILYDYGGNPRVAVVER